MILFSGQAESREIYPQCQAVLFEHCHQPPDRSAEVTVCPTSQLHHQAKPYIRALLNLTHGGHMVLPY